MKNSMQKRKGSAIITAIGMGIVLLFIIAAVQTFSSYRIQTTIQESRKIKALALAEAGLELAIAELFHNASFVTHTLSKDLKWQTPQARKHNLKNDSDHGLKIDSATSGIYQGKLGDGSFKVKVGLIPYEDDDNTKAIDESKSYLKIESLGIYETTVRRVDAVVNRRFPTREFLMYDRGFLSLVYGMVGASNKNVFSTGHLYGHEGVEIGRILMSAHHLTTPGTTQELDDMNALISGAGGIFIYSPIQAHFRAKRGLDAKDILIPANSTFPTAGTYENPANEPYGEYPKELTETTPAFPEEVQPWVKDKSSGMSMKVGAPSFDQYKAEAKTAKGLFFGASDSNLSVKYHMPSGWTESGDNYLNAVYLDFGSNNRDNKVPMPANFNGIVYSEKDIVVMGNPPRDISIVSDKNVFMAGDFNQRGDGSLEELYGFPQDYETNYNALTANDYAGTIREKFNDDIKDTGFKHHFAATVVAKERIVYDYRSPVNCFENELYPFMKYKLAEVISGEATATANCIEKNKTGIISTKPTEEEFLADLDSYFADFPINETAETALKEDLKTLYNKDDEHNFNFDDYDAACRKVWQAYATNYEIDSPNEKGALSPDAKNSTYGVYGLLKSLRKKMNVPGDGNGEVTSPASIKDTAGDFLYYPEFTTNAMFISCGKQNNKFYAGPDVQKYYNEIGLAGVSNIGRPHSTTTHFVHRVFGSETNLRLFDVHRIKANVYVPPTRRKIYDQTLPTLGLDNSKFELAAFVVLSWKDTMATLEEYESF
ncbi:MAG: hypothetical protein EOM80_07945 [Erysipelotrichia bacterium]|nr:hypothetical protein [Erysipelotrichia bacterium]